MSKPDSSSSRSRTGGAGLQPALDAVLKEPAGNVLRRAMWLEAVDRQLRPKLPVSLAARLKVANVAEGRLSLRVDSPAWAHRARLHTDEILKAARSIGLDVGRIDIRVALATATARPLPEKPASPASRAAVDEAIRLLGKD